MRQPNRAATELQAYFLTGESDQGLQSSWEPLANVAQGGFGGSPDPDRRAYRHRLGRGYSAIGQARLVRRALASLPAQQVEVLWAVHGPTPWAKIIDQGYGRGMSLKVAKRFGDLAAVCLLAPRTLATSQGRPGVYLVGLSLDASPASVSKSQAIVAEAKKLLREAERAYLEARGLVRPPPIPLPVAPVEVPDDFFTPAA